MPNPSNYDHIIVSVSGGKDSWACHLHLLEINAPMDRVEWWHSDVDGREGNNTLLWDWPCTPAYVTAAAQAMQVPLYQVWKDRGITGEILRQNAPTKPNRWEMPDPLGRPERHQRQTYSDPKKANTRRMFPAVSNDLTQRWCSPYVKIQPAEAALRGQERFEQSRTLFITGERAQESTKRRKYLPCHPHAVDLRHSRKKQRIIDHWRPVLDWDITDVWAIKERWRIDPHPSYKLGWGRCSCMLCLFGNADKWATINQVLPERIDQVDAMEQRLGFTLYHQQSIREKVASGTPHPNLDLDALAAALSTTWTTPIVLPPGEWQLPRGAYSPQDGPG